MGRVTTATLDDRGRLVSIAGVSTQAVQLMYDGLGRLTALGHGERQKALTYGADGRAATLSDALSHTVQYDRDAAGRVLNTHWADEGVDRYAFNAPGDLVSLTTPAGSIHGFERDVRGLISTYVAPDAGPSTQRTAYTYNAARQLSSVTAGDGASASVAYDSAGRPSSVTLSEGVIDITYDPSGRLFTVGAPGNVGVAFGYDGSLATEMTWTGQVAGAIHIAYDNDFRVASERVNGESPIVMSYDDDGLATRVGALTLTRDPSTGRVTQAAVGSVAESYTFNDLGEPSGSSAMCGVAPLRTAVLTRNLAGAISTISEGLLGQTTTTTYERDRVGRLIGVHAGARDATYTYDRSGNRLSASHPDTVNDVHDAQDRLIQHGATTYAYNARGQLSGKTDFSGTTGYHYDLLGNLRSVRLSSGRRIAYIVDGMGRRIGKTVDGALTQGLLYDSGVNIVAELDGNGGVISRFVYGTRRNTPDYMIRGGATYRILSDQVGSPRLIVDVASCEVVQQIDYDEFGRVLADTNPGFQPFGFAGGLHDRDTGLVRFGARDYDPEIGRWTAKDPLGFQGADSNLYVYAANDPINFIDPTGLSFMQGLSDFFAGFGDTITFGGTRWVRRKLDVDSVVNPCSGWYTTGGVAGLVVATVATSGVGAAAEDGAVAARGMGKLGGIFSRTTNAAGGEVWTSVGQVAQNDFTAMVNSGLMKGHEVKLLTGAHGAVDGTWVADLGMFEFDAATLGQYEGVQVFNFAEMSPTAISEMINGPGTIVGGFCNSGACLAAYMK
jgi:RHS repeat-associated protein